MDKIYFVFEILLLICPIFARVVVDDGNTVEIRAPGIRPTMNDEYICYSRKVPGNNLKYITSFEPLTDMAHVHHMLVYVCNRPALIESAWDCGEMEHSNSALVKAGICEGANPTLIYAWGMEAPSLKLPDGVSFEIGAKNSQHVVIQLHYKDIEAYAEDESLKDYSGVRFNVQSTMTPNLAGIYVLATNGVVPAKSTVYMETACKYSQPVDLHPFAYRVHGHDLDKVNSGYMIHDDVWTELGRRSPQKPQIFTQVTNNVTVKPGDVLAARCTMINNLNHAVAIGSTKKDEMCNFYIMYWINAKDSVKNSFDVNLGFCNSPGWPNYKWSDDLDISNVPLTASTVPGTNKNIEENVLDAEILDPIYDNSEEQENNDFNDIWLND